MLVCLALSPRAGYTESPLFPNQVFTLHSFSNLDCKLFVSHIRLNSFFRLFVVHLEEKEDPKIFSSL